MPFKIILFFNIILRYVIITTYLPNINRSISFSTIPLGGGLRISDFNLHLVFEFQITLSSLISDFIDLSKIILCYVKITSLSLI